MRFTQTFTFRCDICGRQHQDTQELFGLTAPLLVPKMPIGWRNVEERLVCPGHYVKITATVDGTALE